MSKTYATETCPQNGMARNAIYVAVRIAEKYRNRLPTVQELVRDWGMHRATAYRWIAAIRDARGLSQDTQPTEQGEQGNGGGQ